MPPLRKKKKNELVKKKKTSPGREALLRTLRKAARERQAKRRPHQLERHDGNPIMEPRAGNFWEMKATFNPAAVYADRRVHLLYRAIGGDDMSVLGYAVSEDGTTITARSDVPAFAPTAKKASGEVVPSADLEAVLYSSGGGWNGGCEDPRLTLIGQVVYLMYTAFDGWGSIRIALSSIDLDDFLQQKWQWKKPALISPPGEIHKNWMLFPEKINGKYALLHSISPEVLVDYFDNFEDLENEQRTIQSVRHIVSTPGRWDTWVRSAGPPPMKTKLGWLLFYHAMDIRDPDRYKLGAMILDANDPTKVLYRSRTPVLEPDADYENQGYKWGVVYSCGAVVKDGELYVYYGGGDAVSCVAMAKLDTFLDELQRYGTPQLTPQKKGKTSNARS